MEAINDTENACETSDSDSHLTGTGGRLMLTVMTVVVGFTGLVVMLASFRLRVHMPLAHIVYLATSCVVFLTATTVGLYSLVHSQTLKIGTLCSALVIFVGIVRLTKYRYTSLSAPGPS
ncbi:uncharacterized protein RMCC_3485 [Mycolicibacterium canariasense]|uniref:Uncharacterized protein n=1 Tax=Mycolicibacterium canariasense TaxID=228230 RepID=A0A100WEJ9_MYCCR|nr:uncharacterized protein RMCC_3485 [Mycolicibacterium canariasense]